MSNLTRHKRVSVHLQHLGLQRVVGSPAGRQVDTLTTPTHRAGFLQLTTLVSWPKTSRNHEWPNLIFPFCSKANPSSSRNLMTQSAPSEWLTFLEAHPANVRHKDIERHENP